MKNCAPYNPFFYSKRIAMALTIALAQMVCGPIDFDPSSQNPSPNNMEKAKPVKLVSDGPKKTCTAEFCLGLIDGTMVNMTEDYPSRLSLDLISFDGRLNWDAPRFLLEIGDQVSVYGEVNAIGTLWFQGFSTAATLVERNKEFTYREPTVPSITGNWSLYSKGETKPYSTFKFVQLNRVLLLIGYGLCDVVPGEIYDDGRFDFKIRSECVEHLDFQIVDSLSGSFSTSRKLGSLLVGYNISAASDSSSYRLVKQE